MLVQFEPGLTRKKAEKEIKKRAAQTSNIT